MDNCSPEVESFPVWDVGLKACVLRFPNKYRGGRGCYIAPALSWHSLDSTLCAGIVTVLDFALNPVMMVTLSVGISGMVT